MRNDHPPVVEAKETTPALAAGQTVIFVVGV